MTVTTAVDGPTAPPSTARAARPRFTVEVDALAPDAWDRIADEFDDTSYEQCAAWVDGRWGLRRSSHLLVRRDGMPVAGARVVILAVPLLGRGIAYVKFGPIWRRRDGIADPEAYRVAIDALVDEYCARRGHCLTVLPRPTPDRQREECAALAALGCSLRRPMIDPNRYLLNVALEPPLRLESLDQKWRYNLRQALRTGTECRLVEGKEGLATFTALHDRMVARKRFHDTDPVHLLPALAERLPVSMRPRVVLAFHDGAPVAGAVVAACGDTAFYLYGASEDAALPLKAGYALQWWIVNWLPELGVRWYDLGGEALEPGLRQFKKGLVGKRGAVVTTPGEYDRWTGAAGRLAADGIYALRRVQRAVRRIRGRPRT